MTLVSGPVSDCSCAMALIRAIRAFAFACRVAEV